MQAIAIPKEIVIVEDCSTDRTRDILKQLESDEVRVFYQPHNQGKGTALRRGFQEATGDVLVNNAGFGDVGPFADAEKSKLLTMIQVNVGAATELTGLVVPSMRKRGRGKILNVGSTAGFQPGPMMAAYCATKAYLNSLSQALANELARTGMPLRLSVQGRPRANSRPSPEWPTPGLLSPGE